MMSLPTIKIGSLANLGAMSVARLLLSVSLMQLAMTTPFVMAQSPENMTTPLVMAKSPEKEFSLLWITIVVGIVAVVFVKILVVLAVLRYCGIVTQTTENELVMQMTRKRLCQNRLLHGQYSYAEVEAISRNWEEILGKGGSGTVYYGEISNDTSPNAKVALKRLRATSQQGENEFLDEVRLLSRIHFQHLVPVVGFCNETNNQVLIYEYMQKGSLADWLHGEKRGLPDFSWSRRLVIALHAALGKPLELTRLEYLHYGAIPSIIHRDVKSSNILITSEWKGRLADFGLSKTNDIGDRDQQRSERTHWTTGVDGTPGYVDPEYIRTAKLTTKSDVYSFGIVLLELVTGRLPIDYSQDDPELRCIEIYVQSHYQHNLATIADPNLKGNYDKRSTHNLAAIADPNLKGNYNMRSMQKIVEVALQSVTLQGVNRPTMRNVVAEIRSAMELGGDNPASTSTQDSLAETDTGPLLNPQ